MLHSRMLNYLDEVVRAGSVRKAAEQLHVSPTAVNRQILLLEGAIGTPLFQRLPRGMRLTAAGEVMIEHVRQTLKGYRLASGRIDDLKQAGGGDISLVTMNGLASGVVAPAIRNYIASRPRVRFDCRTMFIADIMKSVSDGDADIGLAYNLPRNPNVTVMRSWDAPIGAIVSTRHPLASHHSIRAADCLPYPLIFADESMIMHMTMRDIFVRSDIAIEPTFRSNSIELMKELAAGQDGIAFLSPFDVMEEVRKGLVVHIPITDRAMASNTLMLVSRRKRVLETTPLLFAEMLIEKLDGVV